MSLIVAEFTEDKFKKSVKLLEEIQRLERDKHELEFQASRQRGSTPKLPVAPQQQNLPLKMCLRKRLALIYSVVRVHAAHFCYQHAFFVFLYRTEQNQLKDIKFDFVPGTDSADAISNDLIAAGLLEMKDMVVGEDSILHTPMIPYCTFP